MTSRFQPDSPQWPTSPSFDNFPPASERRNPSSVVVDGKLIVMGGNAGGFSVNEVWSLDPSQPSGTSNQWKSLTPMPGAREAACAASYLGKIYVFGGSDSSGVTNTIFVFDPSAAAGMGSWTTLAVTLPQTLFVCAAAQAGEYIYITGGSTVSAGSPLNTILRFRPDGSGGGAFDPFPVGSVPTLITARINHSATTVNEKIVVVGGRTSGLVPLRSVEMFDPSSNSVSSLPDTIVARYFHQASVLGLNLFVFGGLGGSNSVESLFLPA